METHPPIEQACQRCGTRVLLRCRFADDRFLCPACGALLMRAGSVGQRSTLRDFSAVQVGRDGLLGAALAAAIACGPTALYELPRAAASWVASPNILGLLMLITGPLWQLVKLWAVAPLVGFAAFSFCSALCHRREDHWPLERKWGAVAGGLFGAAAGAVAGVLWELSQGGWVSLAFVQSYLLLLMLGGFSAGACLGILLVRSLRFRGSCRRQIDPPEASRQ